MECRLDHSMQYWCLGHNARWDYRVYATCIASPYTVALDGIDLWSAVGYDWREQRNDVMVVMKEKGGMSWQKIARHFGLSPSHVKKIVRAKQRDARSKNADTPAVALLAQQKAEAK